MTDADRMVAWLREAMDAAQADAEAAAEATGGPHWHGSDSGLYSNDASNHPGPFLADAYGYTDPRVVTHVVRHDPAAVLRRIAADRKTLDDCDDVLHDFVFGAFRRLTYDTVRNLAEGYGWTEEMT